MSNLFDTLFVCDGKVNRLLDLWWSAAETYVDTGEKDGQLSAEEYKRSPNRPIYIRKREKLSVPFALLFDAGSMPGSSSSWTPTVRWKPKWACRKGKRWQGQTSRRTRVKTVPWTARSFASLSFSSPTSGPTGKPSRGVVILSCAALCGSVRLKYLYLFWRIDLRPYVEVVLS